MIMYERCHFILILLKNALEHRVLDHIVVKALRKNAAVLGVAGIMMLIYK